MPKTRFSFPRKELSVLAPPVALFRKYCSGIYPVSAHDCSLRRLIYELEEIEQRASFCFTNSEYFSFIMAVKDDSGFPGNSDERNINLQVRQRTPQPLKFLTRMCGYGC